MTELDPLHDTLAALIRLGLAALIGAIIGLNRELHHKPAGLRTHALVSLSAALAIYLSLDFAESSRAANDASLTRVVQGVLTGIGFLGAGVIFREDQGKTIKGLTTAASIWVTACLGMACGAARWSAVAVGLVITLAVLVFGGPIEKDLRRRLFGQEEKTSGDLSELD